MAGHCTRGVPLQNLTPGCECFRGPEFLKLPEDKWPHDDIPSCDESKLDIRAASIAVKSSADIQSRRE